MSTTLGTWLNTLFTGKAVGTDMYGNRYYQAKRVNKFNARKRRWVIYNGMAEPSKVPPEWHNWLHYTTDNVPEKAPKAYGWQKPHQPNLTGTKGRYLPKGHVLEGSARAKASADYTPWNPDKA